MSMPFGVVAIAPSQDKNEDAEFPIEVVGKRWPYKPRCEALGNVDYLGLNDGL